MVGERTRAVGPVAPGERAAQALVHRCAWPNSLNDGARWAIESNSAPSIAAVRIPISSSVRFVTCLCTDSMSSGFIATRWQNAERVRVELVGRQHPPHQAELLGLVGVEQVAGEQQLLGRRAPMRIGIMPIVTGMPMPRAAGCPNSVPSAANTMSHAPIRSSPPERQ